MNSGDEALMGRIHENLFDLSQVVARIKQLQGKARLSGDDDYMDGVALNLHGFYSGIERIFEDIARSVDESLPEGPDWHRGLLLQMSAEVEHTRPPVIARATRLCVDEYRAFRHVLRNVYTFALRPNRVNELADELETCYAAIVDDLNQFMLFLESRMGDRGQSKT